jgi:AcrR family transcriptional regulator
MPVRTDPHLPNYVMAPQIQALAATGFTKLGIARHFGVSLPTFNRWLEDDEVLQEAFAQGREAERQALHNVLYKLAIDDKDKVSAMFLLKARHGYREGDQSEQSNRVAITFNLPGSMTAEQYRTIEAVAATKDSKRLPNGD